MAGNVMAQFKTRPGRADDLIAIARPGGKFRKGECESLSSLSGRLSVIKLGIGNTRWISHPYTERASCLHYMALRKHARSLHVWLMGNMAEQTF